MSDRLSRLLEFYNSDPSDDFIVFALAQEYEKMEQFEKAMVHYKLLVERSPDYIGTYYHLGKLHQLLEDYENALQVFETGIKRAINLKEMHALAELQNAKTNLEMEML